MFRGFFAGVLVTIVVILVGGYFGLRNGVVPANADATPGPLETWAAHTSLRATLQHEAPTTPNPVALTDEKSDRRHRPVWAALRDLPRHGER